MRMHLAVRAVVVAAGFVSIGIAPARAQTEIRPILMRPDKTHPNCQIYLNSDGSRLLFKGKPIAARGACPSDYLPGTLSRVGAGTYRLKVSGADCIITPSGLGRCQ